MTKIKEVVVLRYGHRKKRDERVTTHCCLVARSFGAKEIIITGEKDLMLLETIKAITKTWGGKFKAKYAEDWLKETKKYKKDFKVVHLTMYGENINKAIKKIKTNKIFVIIGSKKVERKVYEIADYNIAIGNQPHSEVAALAVFLDRLFKGKELEKNFSKARLRIKGSLAGKKIVLETKKN